MDTYTACGERLSGHRRRTGRQWRRGTAPRSYLADLNASTGRRQEASAQLEAALARFRQLGDRFGEGLALRGLGHFHLIGGDAAAARSSITQAHRIWHDLGLPLWTARARASLGELYEVSGDHGGATTVWSQAHAIFQQLNTSEAEELTHQLSRASTG